MTRSIFDPTGSETEHSGSRNLGPDAREISHMPPGFGTGKTDCDTENLIVDIGPPQPPALDPDDSVDASQESDVPNDPDALMEGQATDKSDAPQESSE
jgi:hypothetical protein